MATESDVIGLVLHFRTPERTLACLESLARQGIRKAVLVDNSEDGGRSIHLMQCGLARLVDCGLGTEVLQPERNLGFAAGLALGLEHVSLHHYGPVLLINSDATLETGALAMGMDYLREASCVSFPARMKSAGACASSLVFYQRIFALYVRTRRIGCVRYPSGCCLLFREDLVHPELFDKDFFFYGEDVMLGFDLARRGSKFVECADAAVIHTGSASAKNGSMFYEYHMVRAHWLLARKLARNGFEQGLFVIGRCMALPLRACVRSVRSRSLMPWRGFVEATLDVIRGRSRTITPSPVPSSNRPDVAAT